MSLLDTLVDRARATEVRADLAAARVAEVRRWARAQPEPRRWWPVGVGLAATAAAAVLIVWLVRRGGTVEDAVVRVGDRVAVIAAAGTQYRVAAAGPDATEVIVERGAVTARLWPGARPHRLALRGGDVVATATGTVFTVAVDGAGTRVTVHEGSVDVRDREVHREVLAGASYGAASATPGDRDAAAARLLALAAPPPEQPDAAPVPTVAIDAPGAPPSLLDAARAVPRDRRDAAMPLDAADAAEPTPTERWRTVRLLRGQNKLDEALAECIRIVDGGDATWAPIALLEAARIELGPRASPERAVELVDRLLREWPQHTLAAEARELRCRALRQLGRECA